MFDDIIADISVKFWLNYTSDQEIIHLRKKIKHFTFFFTEPYNAVPENVRLNSTHYFIMKIPKNVNFSKVNLIIQLIYAMLTL